MKFKYPRLAGFIAAIIAAYFIFSNPSVSSFISRLGELKYLGTFIAGIFYTFGFTSPFSAGFFIDLNPSNIWIAGIIGGFGALVGDMLIFEFARKTFRAEFERLKKTKIIKKINSHLDHIILYILAAILIASPLPDEAGITIIAGLTKIKTLAIVAISIALNTIGILILLSL